jgi:hypothetical protein
MRWHQEFFALKLTPHNLGRPSKFDLLDLANISRTVLVLELLLVDEGAREEEAEVGLLVLLVEHGRDLANIALIHFNGMEIFSV